MRSVTEQPRQAEHTDDGAAGAAASQASAPDPPRSAVSAAGSQPLWAAALERLVHVLAQVAREDWSPWTPPQP
jgi:hypothetical protein